MWGVYHALTLGRHGRLAARNRQRIRAYWFQVRTRPGRAARAVALRRLQSARVDMAKGSLDSAGFSGAYRHLADPANQGEPQ